MRNNHLSFICLAAAFTFQCASKPTETPPPADPPSDTTPVERTSARPVHWGYEGEDGPSGWAKLSPTYALCGSGSGQSPINIVASSAMGDKSWNLDYKATSLRIAHNEHMEDIVDNGHTIQVTVDQGSTFSFADKVYHLKQFHFHTPSEHTLDGKHAPMEMHMVHQSDDGSLAVIGILIQEGKNPNPNFEKIIANLPSAKGESKHVTDAKFDLEVTFPSNISAYHYMGSLTTPPCSEGVQWLVFKDPIYLSGAEIAAFSSKISPNNRPVQTLHDRKVELGNLATGSGQ